MITLQAPTPGRSLGGPPPVPAKGTAAYPPWRTAACPPWGTADKLTAIPLTADKLTADKLTAERLTAMSTLSELRDRVEATLQDSTNATWSTGDLDEAIRRALEEYSLVDPLETITTKTLSADGRELDISSITGRIQVTRVWWPYTSTDPEYPANWCTFEEWDDVLFIDSASEPQAAEVVRIWYSSLQTIEDLDSAEATTLKGSAEAMIVTGAAGFAAQQRAVELAEELNVDHAVVDRLGEFAHTMLEKFAAYLQQRASQRAARASGVAKPPRLDRWDQRADEEW